MKITELNVRILDLADEIIASIGYVPNKFGGDAALNQRGVLKKISQNPEIKSSFKVLYGQQIVLLVSAFETYLRDAVRIISEYYPGVLHWPNGNYKIDLNEFADPTVSKGDILLGSIVKQGTSFQDLQSIHRFFKDYIGCSLEEVVDEMYKNQFILATAMRHVIVHSDGVVNKEFMTNIRYLPEAIRNAYRENDDLEINDEDIVATRDTLIIISDTIEKVLKEKVGYDEN